MATHAGAATRTDDEAGAPVTLLFTDVVGSTELLGMLGEEAMEACRREHFALLRAAVAAHGGTEVKNVGDGIMVAFSSPATAVSCAIAMQSAIAGQQLPGERPMRMRIGMHCGPTIAAEGDHWGTTVVVARRLCDAAQAHEILTTAELADLVEDDRDRFRGLGKMSLKGISEQVRVCAVQWDGAPVARVGHADPIDVPLPDALRRGAGRLVARDAELVRLEQFWEQAAAGERRALLIAGEPGIGKSALAAELGRRAHAAGAIVLTGRCDESVAVPFQPFTEALRQLVAQLPVPRLRSQLGGWLPDLGRLLPEVASDLIGGPPRLSAEPEIDQRLMFEAVSQLLATTARAAPVLLVLEDLHWSDAGTLQLLLHVASAKPAAALALVGTVREGELAPGHLLHEPAEPAVERLRLTGLDAAGVRALLEAAGGGSADDQLVRALHARTDGNPLHAGELSRDWSRSGAIVVRNRMLVLAGDRSVAQEGSDVREVIERRIGSLPTDTRRALTLGCVLDRRLSRELMERILAADEPPELAGAVERAVGERMLVESGDGRYAFAHALIRQTLYSRIGASRRARLHCQVADALEETAGHRLQEYLPDLAYHFRRCAHDGRAEKAVRYALEAGRANLSMLAHEPAADNFREALEVLDLEHVPDAETLRCEATIGLGEAQSRLGDGAYRETLLEAARQAERLGDSERLAHAALANSRGFFSMSGNVDHERVATLRAALARLPKKRGAVRARLLAQLATELSYAGDWDARRALSDEALALAREAAEPATLVTVLYQRSVALWGVHGLEQRLEAALEAEPLLDGLADPSLSFQTMHHGAHAALGAGDMALADRRLEAMGQYAALSGQPTHAWYEGVARSKRATVAGRVDDAARLALEAGQIGASTGQPDALVWMGSQMTGVRILKGEPDERPIAVFAAMIEQLPSLRVALSAQMAAVQAERGDLAGGRRTLDRLMAHGLRDVPVDFGWIMTVCVAGYACWRLSARDHAEVVDGVLSPWKDHYVDAGPTWLGSASFFLGLIARAREQPLEAHEHFARAAAMHERCGAHGFQALTFIEWASLLAGAEIAGAPDPAQLAREALQRARALDLPGTEQRAGALLDSVSA